MKFVDILPFLNENARFAIAEWPADTYITKSQQGYISFTFRNNLQESKWVPSRYDVYDANWKPFADVPLPTLKHGSINVSLFRLLDDEGVEAQHANITGTIDVAGFDERGKLYFQNIVNGNILPSEPALELFLFGDWYIKASAEDVTRTLAEHGQVLESPEQPLHVVDLALHRGLTPPPAMADNTGDGAVIEEVHTSVEIIRQSAVSFAPEVSSADEPTLRVRPGVYTAQGSMQQLLVEVHGNQDNIVYLTPYPTVSGAPQEVISASLFEAMFSQLPRLTKGVTVRHRTEGARVTVEDFDDQDVMVSISLGNGLTGNATIPRENFQSDDWDFVSYQPEQPQPVSEANAAPGTATEQQA